ncbi:MAG TPA: lipocalin-like domain-containing protein [Gemmatimonadales bacterium]|nr:lipocalin-like domain-containing protein [Gemmatimonadales bacterium]
MRENPLIGTWTLVAWELRGENGDGEFPFGEDAIGFLFYSPDGYMSVTIMRNNRTKFASEDIMDGSIGEKARAAETYLAYCGRYEIRGDSVIHHTAASLFPNRTGADQKRIVEVAGDRLILSTPPVQIGGRRRVSRLVWKRVSAL